MGGSYDLQGILRNLRSNKITDRKKAFSALKGALQSPSTLASLDRNSLGKVNLTWDIIAGNVIKAVDQELEKFAENAKKNKTSAAAGTDLLSAAGLLRTVVQSANRKQPLLNARKVLEHIRAVLVDGGNPGAALVHPQYTRLLLLLLGANGWQPVLAAGVYNELVDLVCGLLRQDDADVVGLSSTLHRLVSTGFHQEDGRLETVFRTLAGSFIKLRENVAVSQVVPQLATLVEVGRRLGGRRGHLLCAVGEPVARSLLGPFNWKSLQIKELALEFLSLQLSVHRLEEEHPAGGHGDWEGLLRDWNQLLMLQLQERSIGSTTSGQQEARVRKAQVWLAAETLHQLEHHAALASAVASLLPMKPNRDALPWLEVLACYLWRYPETAKHASSSLRKLLDFLTQCYSSCKLQDVKRCIMLCYCSVARAHGPQPGTRPWPAWSLVWDQTVKTVFLNQCVEEGHMVLQELLRRGWACSDLNSLFCPGGGRSMELAALHSVAALLGSAGSMPHLDVPSMALLDGREEELPEKHRWRLWLLELLVPGEGAPPRAATLVPAGELLAALCLARPSAALAPAAWQPLLAWQDPYPWRSKLDADVERRSTAQLLLSHEESARNDGPPTATAAVMEPAWNAALDTLAKQCSAFLDAEDMLPACLYTACMGVVLVARIWCLQGGDEELLGTPLVKQLQGHLRECTEKLVQCSPPPGRQPSGGEQEQPSWLALLDALLSYVEGVPSGHHLWAWLLDALPQELDVCLISTFRELSTDISSSFGPKPSGMGDHIDMGSDDEWADENMPSSSLLHRGSLDGVDDMDADFDFVDASQPASTEAATKQSLLSLERLTREDAHCLATLRLGLSHFCLSRRVGLGDGERTFSMLLQLADGAKKNLTAWSIQSVLLVLRVLFERAELIVESELFSLVDALRELMQVHCRQLDVSAALLDLARLCVPAVSRCDVRSKARDCFLVILEAYSALQGSRSATQGVCNEGVSLAFLRLLLECSQEPWVVLKADKGRPVPVLEYAVRFLGSGHDSVRTLAAQNIGLFLKDPANLEALLPHLTKHLTAVEVSKEDEHLAACLVFATALGNAGIALGPHLGARAAALLVHAVGDKHLPAPLVAKVLAQGKTEQPWSHLPTVVHHWLKQGLPLKELPFEALSGEAAASARQFLERHWQLVLPAAVECCSQEAVRFVSDTLGRPARHLVAEVAPVALSRALPFGGDSAPPPALRFLETCLSREGVHQVMVERLPEVLVSVLQLACDWPDTHGALAERLYPPCLGDGQVKETLRLLEGKCSDDASLVDILLERRDGLQLVLEGLEGTSLAALRHLVDLVAPYLSRAAGLRGSDCYVLRTLTLRLLRRLPARRGTKAKSGVTISAEENRVVCLVARLLRRLYEAAGEHLYKEIERNLPVVVNALAPFVDENNVALAWEVQALVKVLVSDERLETAVLCVRPLPDVDLMASSQGSLKALRTRVRQGNFAQVLSALTRSLREGLLSEDTCVLAALGDLLKQHRAELTGLLEGIQGKTFFSEETTSSPLHQLIVILFEQARSPDKEVRAASLRCLGLLGPVELSLPALGTAHWNPISGMVDCAGEGSPEIAYRLLLGRMHRYLSHADPQLSAVACRALKSALSTRSGVAFATRHSKADMEDTFAFLHPFCSNKVCILERPPGPADAEPWELWAPEAPCDHATWVKNLVCTLVRCSDDHFFWALLPLCELETELCELLFPFVVETLADERTHWTAVVSGVSIFLERHAESRPRDDGQSQSTVSSEPVSTESTSSRVYCSRASVAVIMSAVERMVVRRQARASTLWDGLRLQVDLLKAAQAAEFCGNHVTAVQCVELWWDWQGRARESLSEEEDSGAPLLHWSGRDASTVQSVLLSSFSGLGDLDALTGCRCLALGGSARLLWRHCAEQRGGHWPTLLAQADLEAVGRNARLGHALKQCGLYHTLATYLQGTESPDLAELQAECAWRLADWDCRLPTGSDDTGFQRGIFTTLSSISSREAEGLHSGLSTCRQLLSGQLLAMAQLGSAQELNQLLSKVQMCTVLEEGVALAMGDEEEAGLLRRWEERAAQPGFDFLEPVSWLQGVMVGQLSGSQARAAHAAILSHYAVQSRLNQYPWLARVALKELERCAPELGDRWLLEEARIQLAQGDCTEAQHTLYTLLKQLGHPETTGQDVRAYAEVLQLYGECLAESRSENSDTIAREYFAKAVKLLAGRTAEASLWTAHLRLARFADAQVQGIEQYLRSPEFRAKQELLHQSSHILHCTPATPAVSGGDARTLRLLERQSDLDRGEAASLEAARSRHLLQAVSNYLQCLRGPGHDLRLFRLTSLWFGNPAVPEVNALLEEGLGKLESYKFVPLIYQLAARMSRSGTESTFAKLLSQLIERVVRDHPYQTLPVVLALCNADKDPSEKGGAPRTKKARTSLPSEDRVEGARSLVSRLRKGGGLCSTILPQLERLMDAYIHLAYLDPPSAPRGQPIACVKLPRDTPLLKLGQVDKIPVLTQEVPVDRSASYCNLPGILKFSPEYRLCGGINMPKVVTCVGQDGRSYKQLVKGRDDLRQDAVMQQAFGLVNCLLDQEKGHRATGGRLAMRTYKVVPLSRRSGLVQWCEGTQPFSEFLLTPNTGAHQRYQPQDWAPAACRKAMQTVHKGTPEERLRTYQEVCSHFHPVFRYFFFEHFPEPSRWFERRRAYVHSVATGSIVGYILGLGDRHCANILVDKHSAELIHIDLGVAFEQGRTLNTPETVPFRLTRDVVDGMGICGVEGTFRRCCERTMEVMRASRELLVTVVEVLLHDPLSSWTLSPERAAALQADGSGDVRRSPTEDAAPQQQQQHDQKNRLARRMLLRLEQKLQGLEEGAPLSVAGQVNLLIQQAIDPQNLSRLFPGWQPYV